MRESPDKDPKVTKRAPRATGRAPPAPQGASGAASSCRDPDGDSPSWMGVSWGRPRPSPCPYGREGVGEHPEVSRVASRACPLRLLPGPAPGVRNAQARTGVREAGALPLKARPALRSDPAGPGPAASPRPPRAGRRGPARPRRRRRPRAQARPARTCRLSRRPPAPRDPLTARAGLAEPRAGHQSRGLRAGGGPRATQSDGPGAARRRRVGTGSAAGRPRLARARGGRNFRSRGDRGAELGSAGRGGLPSWASDRACREGTGAPSTLVGRPRPRPAPGHPGQVWEVTPRSRRLTLPRTPARPRSSGGAR